MRPEINREAALRFLVSMRCREAAFSAKSTIWNAKTLVYSSIAQLVEHAAVNRRVVGSSPTGGARRMWLAATAVTASPLFKVVER